MISNQQKWGMAIFLLVAVLFFFSVKAILFPFIAGTALAYLGNPLVKKLEHYKMWRSFAVALVFIIAIIFLLLLLIIIVPLIAEQVKMLIIRLPAWGVWLQTNVGSFLDQQLGIKPDIFNLNELSSQLAFHWKQTGGILYQLSQSIRTSGFALIHTIIYIALTPVVAFYLMRDWNRLATNINELIPSHIAQPLRVITIECNTVLSGFVKGQLLVILALSCLYSTGLAIVGLPFSLLIGMLAGLASIVPYLGFASGLCLAIVVGLFHFSGLSPLISILVVFIVGHVLESMILSPLLVGDKIGLHPVAVIFSVMAGEQLFGLTGIILALPIAAIMKVLLVHLHKGYKNSSLYNLSHNNDD